jgi:hypothetical protein
LERAALAFYAQDPALGTQSLSLRRILALALAGQHRSTEARTEFDAALALERKVPNYASQRDWLDPPDLRGRGLPPRASSGGSHWEVCRRSVFACFTDP